MNSVLYLYYVENGSNNVPTMNGMATEIDPLGSFEYPNYDSYGNMTTPYNYDKKVDGPVPYNFNQNYNIVLPNNIALIGNITTNVPDINVEKSLEIPVVDNCIGTVNSDDKIVNDIKPIVTDGKIKQEKVKGKRSTYWSVKIADKDFAFYGCSVCNISFKTLQELDHHVTVHKDRITSYDLRVQNQMKRKRLKKEKKGHKIKLEKPDIEIEIKPEDGYIGTEKASEFSENCLVSNENNTNSNKNEIENKSDEKKGRSREKKVCKSMEKGEEEKNKDLQKIYKCFACQKQFTLSYYLRLHVRSHTDEKPYTCSVCGQSFITASKLGRHNKRIHLAIRYQCRICFKFFSQFDLLTRHFDKKHVEDKLEGEPYDYNAILPYLKELEEQMKEKTEAEKKPKIEELWPDKWVGDDQANDLQVEQSQPDQEELNLEPKQFFSVISRSPDIVIDEVTVQEEDLVKQELEDDDLVRDDPHEIDYKDDSCSDEDYFPSNTWARVSPPRLEPETPPSPRRTRRSKGDGPITCDICQKTISSVTYLRIHMRTHTGEKPFKCYICNRGFITSSKMHRHVLTHSETWDETIVKREELKSEGEGNEEDFEEDVKGKKVKKSKSKFHKKRQKKGPEKQKKRYQKRPHACEFCQKRFLHLETLQVHKKSHEGEPLVLKCNYCLEEMPDEAARSEHEASHSGPKPYVCTLCGKCYKKKETLVYHRKHHKPDKREYICDICSKRFNSPGKLQRHLVSHRVDKFVLRYECPVCAHMFNTKYHVQMHLSTHQKEGLIMEENRNEILAMVLQNARKFPKQPDAPSNLTDTMPSDERSRICNICGEIFQHFYYLEEHLKGHGSRIAIEDLNKPEEKKYTCQVCKKSFKLHYYLKLHSFTHTKEKPFICQQCGKGFITKGKLKRHLETHTGLKKYQCHVCYKFFTRPSYLRIHVRTIHGTQDYNFRLDKGYGSLGGLSVMTHLSQGSV